MEVKESDSCIVKGSVAVILRVSQWCALVPLRFVRLRSGEYRVQTSRVLFFVNSMIFFIVGCLMIGSRIYTAHRIDLEQYGFFFSTIGQVLVICDVFISICIISLAIFGGMNRIKRLLYILKQLQETNAELDCDNSFEQATWKVWLTVSVCVFGPKVLMLAGFILNTGFADIMSLLLYFMLFGLVTLLVIRNAISTLAIHSSIKFINYRMKLLYNGHKVPSPQSAFKNLESLSHAFCSIHNIVTRLNDLDGGLLFLILLNHIFHFMLTVHILLSSDSFYSIPNLITLMWLLIHIAKILLLIEPNQRLMDEMEETKHQLSIVICTLSCNGLMYKQSGSFFQQFLINKPSFKPLGIFTLNRALLATVAGIVVTFVMVVNEVEKALK